jgi:hypothetical protein
MSFGQQPGAVKGALVLAGDLVELDGGVVSSSTRGGISVRTVGGDLPGLGKRY